MSCLFLSHSSVDEADALALRDWLVENGWDDLFLDLDPKRGLVAGDRWQDALGRAVRRCEGVLFVITPNWLNSDWCRTEFFYAKSLNKPIFGIVTKQVKLSNIPVEITAEFQLVDLSRKGEKKTFDIKRVSDGRVAKVTFNKTELKRLKAGLLNAGINADHFDWPPPEEPNRAPYRGLSALQQKDAGIFFGRDGQIVEALDRLRGLRNGPPPRMLVVLGASGSGKSSFMRAGLLPRLTRDDRHFIVLDTIRPGQGAITGDSGFISSLKNALEKKGVETSRAKLAASVITDDSELAGSEPQSMSADRIVALVTEIAGPVEQENHREAVALPKPAIVIPVDQAEELYFADSGEEAEQLKRLLAALARSEVCQVIVLLTIRSDAFQRLQFDTVLGTVGHQTLSLPPVVQGAYSEIILGPVRRLNDSERKFSVEDPLVEQLLQDIEKGGAKDALPLLAFTLERLYAEYRTGDTIRLADYHTMGGIGGAIEAAVEQTLKKAAADPHMPGERASLLALLRRGLIPWLAGVDPDTRETRRKVARLSDIPEEARPVIEHLVEQRLLSTDVREIVDDAGEVTGSEITIEPAHEALLRQWGLLEGWLEEDFEALSAIEGVQRAALEWESNNRVEDWLAHSAGRLETAEKFAVREDLADHLTQAEKQYLSACRKQENQRVNQALEAQKKINRRTRMGLVAASVLTFIAVATAIWGWTEFTKSNQRELETMEALAAANRSQSLHLQSAALDAIKANDANLARTLLVEATKKFPDNSQDMRLREIQSSHLHEISRIERFKMKYQNRFSLFESDSSIWRGSGYFSPDGKTIAAGMIDGSVRLWDVNSGVVLIEMKGHSDSVNSAMFSPDGKLIVTASDDKTARIWETVTGNELAILDGHQDVVHLALFSTDGKSVVTASNDNIVRVWDANSGEIVAEMRGHSDKVNSTVFSSDGKLIVTASDDKTARIWDTSTGTVTKLLAGHTGPVNLVIFSPDGTQLVSASSDRTARIWKFPSGELDAVLSCHVNGVGSAEFSSDGKMLMTIGEDEFFTVNDPSPVCLWNAGAGNLVGSINSLVGNVSSARIAPTGQSISLISFGDQLEVWSVLPTRRDRTSKVHTDAAVAAFSADGQSIMSSSFDYTIRFWDANFTTEKFNLYLSHETLESNLFKASVSGRYIFIPHLEGTHSPILLDIETGERRNVPEALEQIDDSSVAAFSSDGKMLATANRDGRNIQIWEIASGKVLVTLTGPGKDIRSMSFSPDGQLLAIRYRPNLTGHISKIVGLWKIPSGTLHSVLEGHEGPIRSISFSPNGRYLATASLDKTVRLWEVASGNPHFVLEGHDGFVDSVSFSQDGRLLLTKTKDGVVSLWEVLAGKVRSQVFTSKRGNRFTIYPRGQISSDGSLFLTVQGNPGTIQVWDVNSGSIIGYLNIPANSPISVQFSPDGNKVLAGYRDGTIRIWDIRFLPFAGEQDLNAAKVIRSLSKSERKEYIFLATEISVKNNSCDLFEPSPFEVGISDDQLLAVKDACKLASDEFPNSIRYKYRYARTLLANGKEQKAIGILDDLSGNGDGESSLFLGVLSERPEDNTPSDFATAHKYFLRAQEQGMPASGDHIARHLWLGQGVEQDREQAIKVWNNSAAKGDPFSHATLAGLYHRGRYEPGNTFIKSDLQKAFLHYAIATRLFESSGDETNAASVRPTKGSLAHILPAEDVVRIWREAQAWQPMK